MDLKRVSMPCLHHTYLVEMENQIQLAYIFKTPVKCLDNHLAVLV